VSFRTAAILSVVLVGGMFMMPHAGYAVAQWYVEHPVEIPLYARLFLGVSSFFASFRILLALPTVAVLFTIAIFTSQARAGKMR